MTFRYDNKKRGYTRSIIPFIILISQPKPNSTSNENHKRTSVYCGTRSGRISDLLGAMRGCHCAMKIIAIQTKLAIHIHISNWRDTYPT